MRLSQGKAPATVRLDLMVISHLFTIAIKEWGLPLINPVANIRKPSVNNARTRRLEGNELERILKHCSNEMRVWIIVAIETAMRRSEQHSLSYGMIQGNVIRLSFSVC
jgi:integrase